MNDLEKEIEQILTQHKGKEILRVLSTVAWNNYKRYKQLGISDESEKWLNIASYVELAAYHWGDN